MKVSLSLACSAGHVSLITMYTQATLFLSPQHWTKIVAKLVQDVA
jgi:hypothetical protein